MKWNLLIAVLLFSIGTLRAENKTTPSPVTMQQLMREFRIQGGNFAFDFDAPVFARVSVLTTEYPAGKKETVHFDTATASKRTNLYFTASPMRLGEFPSANADNEKKFLINLSGCPETGGTRILYYREKFVESRYAGGDVAEYDPAIPAVPETGKEYVLYWYSKRGDPYEVKATIAFSPTPFAK